MTRPTTSRLKFKDITYGLLGFVVGFSLSFIATNAIQRETVLSRGAATTAQLPPDHPPIDGGSTGASAPEENALPPGHPPLSEASSSRPPASMAPPPLPSLEPRPGPGPKAETVFEDIQVLKGLPPKDVQRIMGIITVSLGVDCNYCHVPGSFASPHPKKETARKMLQMVRELNEKFLGGKVNCYTCHRGSPKPPTP